LIGVSNLVALTTTGAFSFSAGAGEGDGVGLCARPGTGAAINQTINNNQQRGYFHITSFLHLLRGGLVAEADRPRLSFFFFTKKFFRAELWHSLLRLCPWNAHRQDACATTARMRWSGQIFWLLACGPESFRGTPSSRLHPRKAFGDWLMGSCIQLQQRNCSGFAPDFSRRSTNLDSQRTARAIAACAHALKIYLVTPNRLPWLPLTHILICS
jgi:hypothetical protein